MSTSNSGHDPDELSPERVGLARSQLEDIIASNAFAGSKRAQHFLQLIVEHRLAGRFDHLRERMIGAEMFGRPVDYDTANDAVVRVKASEVRKKLAQYYHEAARKPAVHIELPVGSYVPRFRWEPLEAPATSQVEEDPPASEEQTAIQAESGEKRNGHLRPWPRAIAVLGFAVLAMIGYAGFERWSKNANAAPEISSIVILPLQNRSGDPSQDYFADGMTDELIADMGQISALHVISRTSSMSYRGTKKTLPQIARELGVDAVVDGSVAREGNEVRVTAELIDARTDHDLWTRTYVRQLTTVLALQGEVSQAIADEIRIELTPREQARLARKYPVDSEAQDLYLRGIHLLNSEQDPAKAIPYLQDSIDRQPNCAAAHAALANAYGWMGEAGWLPYAEAFSRQKAEATKAIALDDALPEGHVELGSAVMNLDWEWTEPEKEFKRALELNPNSASSHASYASYLARIGRVADAIAESKRNVELDPVSSRSFMTAGFANYFGRRYNEALAETQKAYALDSSSVASRFPLAAIYVEKGMYAEAIQEFQKIGDQPHALGHLGNVYARMGRVAEANETISKLKEHVQKTGIGRYEIALVHAGLGNKDEALSWLEKSYEAHDKGLTYLKIDPCLDPLRSGPRFAGLVLRMGFPR